MATPEPIAVNADQVYDALYQAVGDGLRGQPDSIVEAWRYARSAGIAAFTVDWRAALQAFPQFSSDFISVYEDLLDYSVDPTLPLEDQQADIAVRYTQVIDATNASLLIMLQKIDIRFSIVDQDPDLSSTTECGARAFEDWSPASVSACGPAFDLGRTYSLVPNYSSDFIVPVNLGVVGPVTAADKRAILSAREALNDALPAWVDHRVVVNDAGFILDEDLLDVTAFGT